ncbi:MAG: hypothetical protein NWF05_09175 [Candidatus Bathyarchaeota archaeon]|nr:hypothetical protein [Candidatus Bathyarchaeota archaeon]
MKRKELSVVLVSLLLISTVFLSISLTNNAVEQTSPGVYVGVDMAYCPAAGSDAAKVLIDQVSGFTNLFVMGTTGITDNSTVLSDVLQYAYNHGLSFVSFLPKKFGNASGESDPNFFPQAAQWLEDTQTNWGDQLLGFLHPVKDEPGGNVLDNSPRGTVKLTNLEGCYINVSGQFEWVSYRYKDNYVANHTDAALKFEKLLNSTLHNSVLDALNSTKNYPLFTSDYALYWFDYKGGYDTVFAEFNWNNSRQLSIALCRGAAQMQNKDWGIVITYTYTNPPYIEPGDKLYEDMVLAYNSGAKYIIVFDANENYTQGILQPEHLQAMQKFWDYAKSHPRNSYAVNERRAYVLPYGFAYAFRGSEEKLWGLWKAINGTNELAFNQTIIVHSLLQKYGDGLDIIYDDNLQPQEVNRYCCVLYWNDPSLLPSPMPTPWPLPTPEPSPPIIRFSLSNFSQPHSILQNGSFISSPGLLFVHATTRLNEGTSVYLYRVSITPSWETNDTLLYQSEITPSELSRMREYNITNLGLFWDISFFLSNIPDGPQNVVVSVLMGRYNFDPDYGWGPDYGDTIAVSDTFYFTVDNTP